MSAFSRMGAAAPPAFPALLDALRAAAEETRLRLLALLAEAELTVSDLTDILGQSQPRISRHLKQLVDAGLVERHREASWIFYRSAAEGPGAAVLAQLRPLLHAADATLARDLSRLDAVRAGRQAAAQDYFSAHADEWARIRSLHVPEAQVEAAMRRLLGTGRLGALLDLGTGTGRMLELFGAQAARGLGLDLSPDMLAVARANLERAGLAHCTVRQGNIFRLDLPPHSFDTVILHQVLHFLDDGARALAEAARVLRPGGRLLVVDFAPHDLEFLRQGHAHRRLGFAAADMTDWMHGAGLTPLQHELLAPSNEKGDAVLTVSLWLAEDPRRQVAAFGALELA